MSKDKVNSLLDSINELPMVPKAVRELLEEFARPEPDIDRISKIIGADPVLATKLLRMANSAFYHRQNQVNSLDDAVIFVGIEATRNLVLAAGVAGSLKFPQTFPRQAFWRFSLHSAVAARHLARLARLDPDEAFATSLIRGIGEPLLASAMGDTYGSLDRECAFYEEARLQVETRHLEFNFVDVTATLAERWHFPTELTEALRASAAAALGDIDNGTPIGLAVSLGAWIAGESEAGRSLADTPLPESISARLARLKLNPAQLQEMPPLQDLAEGLEELVS